MLKSSVKQMQTSHRPKRNFSWTTNDWVTSTWNTSNHSTVHAMKSALLMVASKKGIAAYPPATLAAPPVKFLFAWPAKPPKLSVAPLGPPTPLRTLPGLTYCRPTNSYPANQYMLTNASPRFAGASLTPEAKKSPITNTAAVQSLSTGRPATSKHTTSLLLLARTHSSASAALNLPPPNAVSISTPTTPTMASLQPPSGKPGWNNKIKPKLSPALVPTI